jgi:hypothetical protein
MEAVVVIGVFVVLYGLFHHRHYRRRRRLGCGFWVSMRGPWGLRDTVSKRW